MPGRLRRLWVEMTTNDFQQTDMSQVIAILPVAAIEQHGPHLPVEVDTAINRGVVARARELLPAELPVTFLPAMPIGKSNEHIAYPGTLTLSAETLIRLWTEIGESVARAGVRKLVLITSHGGNVSAMEIVARDLRVRLGMLVVTVGWHRFGYPDGAFDAEERRHGIHGGDIETSLMLAGRPDTVRMDKAEAAIPTTVAMAQEFHWLGAFRPAGFGWMTQDLHASGTVGDASRATVEKGEAAIAHGARGFIELLREVDRFDLARLQDGPLKPL